MIAIVTINVSIGDVEGLLYICLPYLVLEPVMDKLNTKFWFSNMNENVDETFTEDIQRLIVKANVPVTAILGNSAINVSEFAALQVGDIIQLDTKVDDELDIYVGDIRKFTALPGSSGRNYAVRITEVVREEEDG